MIAPNGWQIVLFIFMTLQTLAMFARFYVKTRILKEVRPEDWAIIFSYIVSIVFDVILALLYYMNDGDGASLGRIPLHAFGEVAWMSYIDEILYPIATLAVKIALGMMLARIFAGTWQSKAIIISMAFYTFIGMGYFFFILFYCGNPVQWLTRLALDQCKGRSALFPTTYIHSVATILIDIMFVVLPWSYIHKKANMDRRTKLSVCGILALGSLGVVFTIARIPFLQEIARPADNGWFKAAQSTAVMSAIEIALGIICFCLTACKPLFKSFFRVAAAYTYRGSSQNQSQNGSKAPASQQDDIEKSAHAKEEGTITGSSDEDEAGSSSTPSESDVVAKATSAVVFSNNTNKDGAPPIQNSNPFRKFSRARRESDNVITPDDHERRKSRIRSWDMRFYGIFNRADKPPPVITETNPMSPVSTRDMRFYGVDKMDLMHEVTSNTSHEAVKEEHTDQPAVIATARPILPAIRTRDMSVDANGMLMPGPLSYHPIQEE